MSKDRELFQKLKTSWKEGTAHFSSPIDIAMHESYQSIIGMGERALPFIFEQMSEEPDYWFWALRHITGENPIHTEHKGNLSLMTVDWLSWAREHGHDPYTKQCPTCFGHGEIATNRSIDNPMLRECEVCNGKGRIDIQNKNEVML